MATFLRENQAWRARNIWQDFCAQKVACEIQDSEFLSSLYFGWGGRLSKENLAFVLLPFPRFLNCKLRESPPPPQGYGVGNRNFSRGKKGGFCLFPRPQVGGGGFFFLAFQIFRSLIWLLFFVWGRGGISCLFLCDRYKTPPPKPHFIFFSDKFPIIWAKSSFSVRRQIRLSCHSQNEGNSGKGKLGVAKTHKQSRYAFLFYHKKYRRNIRKHSVLLAMIQYFTKYMLFSIIVFVGKRVLKLFLIQLHGPAFFHNPFFWGNAIIIHFISLV